MKSNLQHNCDYQNKSYYDLLAENYDELLKENEQYIRIREQVSIKINKLISNGNILDFGGGTGEDLLWLSKGGYQIFFCEPSEKMMQIANEKVQSFLYNKIIFLEGSNTDFRNWKKNLPFEEKIDLILANFAVINNIEDLNSLFENLALVTKPGSYVFLNILNFSLRKKMKINKINAIKMMLCKKSMKIETKFKGESQWVYLHSVKKIMKAAKPYFKQETTEILQKNEFMLIQLIKK